MRFLELFFGGEKKEIKRFLNEGALILDVRTLREYKTNHIENSLHVPLNDLQSRKEELKYLNKPFIVCCQSGVRSAKATKFLRLNNINATNGGGWKSLRELL